MSLSFTAGRANFVACNVPSTKRFCRVSKGMCVCVHECMYVCVCIYVCVLCVRVCGGRATLETSERRHNALDNDEEVSLCEQSNESHERDWASACSYLPVHVWSNKKRIDTWSFFRRTRIKNVNFLTVPEVKTYNIVLSINITSKLKFSTLDKEVLEQSFVGYKVYVHRNRFDIPQISSQVLFPLWHSVEYKLCKFYNCSFACGPSVLVTTVLTFSNVNTEQLTWQREQKERETHSPCGINFARRKTNAFVSCCTPRSFAPSIYSHKTHYIRVGRW